MSSEEKPRKKAVRITDFSDTGEFRETEFIPDGTDRSFVTDNSDYTGSDYIDASKQAIQYAMRLVGARPYIESKLREKLNKKGFSDRDADAALEYVKKFGYVNDFEMCQGMVGKLAARLWGEKKIRRYFYSKGISEDIIDRLDFSEVDFDFFCSKLSQRYPKDNIPKMMRALINAGYSYEEIGRILKGVEIPEFFEE